MEQFLQFVLSLEQAGLVCVPYVSDSLHELKQRVNLTIETLVEFIEIRL